LFFSSNVEVGDLGYWPGGQAFCIFFGPTPVSTDDRPRAASPVNIFGRILGDATQLKAVKNAATVRVELLEANIHLTQQMREENTLNICPVCKKGSLAITYSKKTKRHFIACNAYPDCKTTYSLPPGGMIKKTGKNCESCGFPMLIRISRGKRPWVFCFNTECEKNKKRIEEYQKKKEKEK